MLHRHSKIPVPPSWSCAWPGSKSVLVVKDFQIGIFEGDTPSFQVDKISWVKISHWAEAVKARIFHHSYHDPIPNTL